MPVDDGARNASCDGGAVRAILACLSLMFWAYLAMLVMIVIRPVDAWPPVRTTICFLLRQTLAAALEWRAFGYKVEMVEPLRTVLKSYEPPLIKSDDP